MANITFNTSLSDTEGTWKTYAKGILLDEVKIGCADIMLDTNNEDEVYLGWIGIDEEHQNKGYGTQVMHMLAKEYEFIYFAPCDEDNVRLYERFAEECGVDAPEVDQGFGVYYMEG